MGYGSTIKIKRKEFSTINNLLLSYGFKKNSTEKNNLALSTYIKFIDDRCKCFEGVTFTIVKLKGYYLCGRNTIRCSTYDLKLHNDTLEQLSVDLNRNYNTDEGKNKLFNVGTLTEGFENALAFPFKILHNYFEDLLYFLTCIKPLCKEQKMLNQAFDGFTPFNQESFGVNILLIYLISILENYFKSTFINLLKCLSTEDLNKVIKITKCQNYAKKQFKNGEINIYEKLSSSYSFQNIGSIINTFKNCFDIDLDLVFQQNTFLKETRKKVFEKLFKIRHENVHKLEYEYITNEQYIKFYSIVAKTLNDVYRFLCKHYKVRQVANNLYRTSYKKNLKFFESSKN